jgi:hypothetical protein
MFAKIGFGVTSELTDSLRTALRGVLQLPPSIGKVVPTPSESSLTKPRKTVLCSQLVDREQIGQLADGEPRPPPDREKDL